MAQWVYKDKAATLYAKSEGASQMVANLVSADYGWLKSPDGKEEAQILFKAGKNCEGILPLMTSLNRQKRPSIS